MCIDKNTDILVVDDSEDNLLLMQLVFEIQGCNIRKAQLGNNGIHEVHQARPDLIILDLMMPDMSGFEFMRYLKNNGLSDIPIILLTANAYVDKQEAYDAYDVCYKPIDLDNLLSRVELLLPCPNACGVKTSTTAIIDIG